MSSVNFLDCELEAIRTAISGGYDQTLDIYRRSAEVADNYGGYEGGDFALLHSGIPCEIYPGIAHVVDMLDQGQLVDTQLYTISVSPGTDVLKGDQVVITSWNDLKLSVNVVFQPESNQLELRFVADEEILSG